MSSSEFPPPAPQAPEPGAVAPGPIAPTGNRFGRASLVLAGVVALINIVGTVVSYSAPAVLAGLDFDYSAYGLIFVPLQVATALVAAAGLTLGIIGLLRPGLPRGAAGAGTGVAALVLFELTLSAVATAAVSLI